MTRAPDREAIWSANWSGIDSVSSRPSSEIREPGAQPVETVRPRVVREGEDRDRSLAEVCRGRCGRLRSSDFLPYPDAIRTHACEDEEEGQDHDFAPRDLLRSLLPVIPCDDQGGREPQNQEQEHDIEELPRQRVVVDQETRGLGQPPRHPEVDESYLHEVAFTNVADELSEACHIYV
jgi:hypothetical protein